MLKEVNANTIVTESRMDNKELAVVLRPRHDTDWPEFINYLNFGDKSW
jgi:hypothetical protein